MSATSEYEPVARQDYGPATSSENVYEHVLEHKLTDTMNVPNVRPPVLRAVPLSPTEGDPEPDSTNPESIIQSVHKVDKEVEYHIAEKRCDTEMSVDSISGIVRIEETIDNVSHIAYPIIQEADDSNDGNYVENSATLIQAPLNTAIVHNVAKLPQNFTINVDPSVANITAIHNVSQDVSGGQTLWLPTILATSATSDSKNDEDRPQAGVSQIIISDSYVNDASQAGRRANIVTETSYISRPKTSKVQILSNISLPKSANYSQQYITQSKEITTPVYGTQNHIYKLGPNVVSQKHLGNSVLCTKPQKNQSLIGCSTLSPNVLNSSPVKSVSYSHSFAKGTNLNKTLNKVNNGANINAMVAASSGNTQCHILSRVVSGPNKMSVHSGRKSVNTFKSSKSSSQVSAQKNQSRAIKIIQQTGTVNKSETKTWPVASVTYKAQQPAYGVVEASPSKIIQKVGSPTNKAPQPMSLQKFPAKGERLVLQSPCGPVLISTAPISTSLGKAPHYVQSGATPNLRYVQTYGTADNPLTTVSQVSANQQLTAQILQSLSQPKLMLAPAPPAIVTHSPPAPTVLPAEEPLEIKPSGNNQRRIVFGDKSTLLTADDIIGMEERPNLSEELRRYSFQSLALIMLDHTYSLPAQKQPAPASPAPAPASASAPAPASPLRRTSPVIVPAPAPAHDAPAPVAAPIIAAPPAAPLAPEPPPQPAPDDDAASVISSLDGERPAQGGSDTETAPEGEDEGRTRCICDFTHDDGYMICCDRCGEWQHVDCMGVDRANIPDAYMCALCQPRAVDRRHARAIQLRKREELSALGASDTDSSDGRAPGPRRKRLLTVTTYTDTSGACVTTYNSSLPALPPPPQPALALPKRGPKRPRKAEAVRKGAKRKLVEKRVKRKKEMLMNRSKYASGVASQASHWQEAFELAVTNHYSPELRAKIVKYSGRLGNTPNMASAVTAHLCTNVPHAGGKILIATKDLKENTPIIELRGKYMLSNQHRPQLQNSARAGSQKPGPFVFFYRLPKDNTQICIDTRTYGNEARFVRRSCKPNAELQHCIVKGALHVYLVTIGIIQSNTEITIGHDTDGSKQPCACGNPKHCKINGLSPMMTRKSVDYPPREKRSRNRCLSSSSPMSPPLEPPSTPVKVFPPSLPIKTEKKSPVKHEYPPMSPVKLPLPAALACDEPLKAEPPVVEDVKPVIDLIAKEELKPEIDEPDFVKSEPIVEEKPEEPVLKTVIEKVKAPAEPEPIIEEPKPQKPQVEEVIKEEVKPEPEPVSSDDEKPELPELKEKERERERKPKDEPKSEPKIEPKIEDERPMTRELAAKSACHDRSSRSSRTCVNQDSLDDKTDDSQDKIQTVSKDKDKKKMTREERKMEAIMKAFERMEKAQQRKQEVKERQRRRESDPPPGADRDDDDDHAATKRRRKVHDYVKERQRRRESDPPPGADRDDDDDHAATKRRRKVHDYVKERQRRRESDPPPGADRDDDDDHAATKRRRKVHDYVKERQRRRESDPPPDDDDDHAATKRRRKVHDYVKERQRRRESDPPPGADREDNDDHAATKRRRKFHDYVKERQRRRESDPPPGADREDNDDHAATKRRRKFHDYVKERQRRRESDPPPGADREDNDDHAATKRRRKRKGRARTTSQSNRRRLNSADSDMVTSGDEGPPLSPPRAPLHPLPHPLSHPEPHPAVTDTAHEDLGLSSACLLVEAAVGSVESAFKLPKTKKTMATEWVGRSPERTPSPYRSPYRPALVAAPSLESLVQTPSPYRSPYRPALVAAPSLESLVQTPSPYRSPYRPALVAAPSLESLVQTPSPYRSPYRPALVAAPSLESLVQTPSPYRSPYRPALVAAPSLESLVQVASTMIGDLSAGHDLEDDPSASPPRTPARDRSKPPKKARRVTRSTPEAAPTVQPQHSAKKRWLRQAISEESDSPSAESPPNEMVTPLKKRRLARESLSCEQNIIVPCHEEASPVLTSEDSPVKDDPQAYSRQYKMRNIMEGIYGRDRTRSDSGQGSDEQGADHDALAVSLGAADSEHIRRIIGVPTPEDELPPDLKPDDFKTNNNNVETEDTNYTKVVPMEIDTTIPTQLKIQENDNLEVKGIDSPTDKPNSCQSADTSGNSSPQRDEMDDIQKKIHSFHTENILILKSRNKKPPKEKRKKVNLNFDLNMVDDQISIQLRTENDSNSKSPEINGDAQDEMGNSIHDDKLHVSPENIPLPPVESIPLPAPENIPLPEEPSPPPVALIPPPETIPLPEEPMKPMIKVIQAIRPASPVVEKVEEPKPIGGLERPSVLDNSTLPFSSRFSSTGLFSGIFSNITQSFNVDPGPINENVPSMSIIKSAIDRTTSLDSSLFDKDSVTPVDELKSVQEILTRVNNMDSNNSVILSGVLKSSNKASLLAPPKPAGAKPYCPRNNDPRLNPPPVEKPKPVRRKLSITEYRKRQCGAAGGDDSGSGGAGAAESAPDWSSGSSAGAELSPQRLDAAAAAAVDDLEQRLHRELACMPKETFSLQCFLPRHYDLDHIAIVENSPENLNKTQYRLKGLINDKL
ncbi:uncharacterized protein LOC135071322 [Ostrinia nubilalis]|uniref:uncharacterized protein LOC135071322 n=1 Tax=Ostrinia nubilalis TaxID=29057 RepID=UPI0030826699